MINPTVHLRICLSIHQRDCLFPPIEHPPPPLHCITFNWIPAMKFHPWHCSLFLCPFFPYCIKSRDHFAAILSRRLSLNSPHPNVSLFAYASITQRLLRQCLRTFVHTHQTFWIKRSWTKSWEKKRDTLFPKWIGYAQQSSFHLVVKCVLRAWNVITLQAKEYTPTPIVYVSTSSWAIRAIHIVTRNVAPCFHADLYISRSVNKMMKAYDISLDMILNYFIFERFISNIPFLCFTLVK